MPETTLEERIAGLEGSYKEVTKRIDDLRTDVTKRIDDLRADVTKRIDDLRSETHRGLDGVRGDLERLRSEVSELRHEGRANFRWTMTLILVNWLSLLAGIFLVVARK